MIKKKVRKKQIEKQIKEREKKSTRKKKYAKKKYRKKTRETVAHAHTLGWPSVTSGSLGTSGNAQWYILYYYYSKKEKTRETVAQLPVAHAQNILPGDWRHFRSGPLPVTWLTSLPVSWLADTWLPVAQRTAPPQMLICPYPYTTHGSYNLRERSGPVTLHCIV